MDPVHRRAAGGDRAPGARGRPHPTPVPGHVLSAAALRDAHASPTRKSADAAAARAAVRRDGRRARCAAGARLRPEALAVTFAGRTIAELARAAARRGCADACCDRRASVGPGEARGRGDARRGPASRGSPSLVDLGLGYLSLDRTDAHAVAGRAAAAAARDPAAVGAVRRRLRARRAVGGAAPGRHRAAARRARPAQGRGQLGASSSSTTWTWCGARTGSSTSARGAGEHGGQVLYSGPVAGLAGVEESVTRALPVPRRGRGARRREPREPIGRGCGCAASPAQPARTSTPQFPLGRVHGGDRRVRVGQVDAGHPGARGRRARHLGPAPAGCRRRRGRGRARRRRASVAAVRARAVDRLVQRRPEADRPHPAVEPRHVHRAVRRGAQAVRGDRRGAGARLDGGPVLLQRGRRPLRDLPGRGLRRRRAAVPARHVRARARRATARATTPETLEIPYAG